MARHSTNAALGSSRLPGTTPLRVLPVAIREMKQHPNSNVLKSVVVIWLTLSIAGVVLGAINWRVLSTKLAAGKHGVAVQLAAQRVMKMALDCENGERGYVITGKED